MTAEEVVGLLLNNLAGRKGIGDEWDSIDPEIQEEIRQDWIGIVENYDGSDHYDRPRDNDLEEHVQEI